MRDQIVAYKFYELREAPFPRLRAHRLVALPMSFVAEEGSFIARMSGKVRDSLAPGISSLMLLARHLLSVA